MGLALLANLSGMTGASYPGKAEPLERTSYTFDTLARLERYQGHFYNWVWTRLRCRPLPPLYVSSVDSGNLAAHLMTLRAGLAELPDHKILASRVFDGLVDTSTTLMDDETGKNITCTQTVAITIWVCSLRCPAPIRYRRFAINGSPAHRCRRRRGARATDS